MRTDIRIALALIGLVLFFPENLKTVIAVACFIVCLFFISENGGIFFKQQLSEDKREWEACLFRSALLLLLFCLTHFPANPLTFSIDLIVKLPLWFASPFIKVAVPCFMVLDMYSTTAAFTFVGACRRVHSPQAKRVFKLAAQEEEDALAWERTQRIQEKERCDAKAREWEMKHAAKVEATAAVMALERQKKEEAAQQIETEERESRKLLEEKARKEAARDTVRQLLLRSQLFQRQISNNSHEGDTTETRQLGQEKVKRWIESRISQPTYED
jgi:hypothetical protein